MCYHEGILQAYLDGELSREQQRELEDHLKICRQCRQSLDELTNIQNFTVDKMSNYLDGITDQGHSHETRPKTSYKEVGKMTGGLSGFIKKYRRAVAVAAATIALVATFTFPAVRSVAGEFLTIFRMEKVQTISIDPQDLHELKLALEEGTSKVDVRNFGQVEVTGKQETFPVTISQAAESVDFSLKMPQLQGFGEPELKMITTNTLSLTLDVDNVNMLLQAMNSPKMLPRELNGKTFNLNMPNTIVANYNSEDNNIMVAQAKSPELKAPKGVNVSVIRDALLSIPALPENLREQLLAVSDWQHTVLIPNVNGESEELQVNGVQGVFIKAPSEQTRNDHFNALVWQKDGVVYSIAGANLEKNTALEIARQMN